MDLSQQVFSKTGSKTKARLNLDYVLFQNELFLETFWESRQASKMEPSTKLITSLKPLIIFAKNLHQMYPKGLNPAYWQFDFFTFDFDHVTKHFGTYPISLTSIEAIWNL